MGTARTAIITGGCGGLGLAMATALAEQGARVVITDGRIQAVGGEVAAPAEAAVLDLRSLVPLDREALRDGLLTTRAYPGVTGVLSMRSDGNASKRPYLLAVERGRIVQVEERESTPAESAALP